MSTPTTVATRRFKGVTVELKFDGTPEAAEAGRSWYVVIGKRVFFPPAGSSVADERRARAWANWLCRKRGLLAR